jgi:glycerol kinase
VEGSAFHCGYSLGWLSERTGRPVRWSTPLGPADATVDDRLFILPSFTSMGAPRWPRRRGAVMTGLAMDTTPDDMMRAAVEAMAFQAYDLFAAMSGEAAASCTEVGGRRRRGCQRLPLPAPC